MRSRLFDPCKDLDMVKKKAEKHLKNGYAVDVHQIYYNDQNCYGIFAGLNKDELEMAKMYFKVTGNALLANITNTPELHDFFVNFYTGRFHNICRSARCTLQQFRAYIRHFVPHLDEEFERLEWEAISNRYSSDGITVVRTGENELWRF